MPLNLGQYLIRLLEAYGVDTVFGIPGVHTAELYRGLAASPIRHVAPRHEQGAGFMADGYARISGRPGVCFVITGPGLANIATAMLQARADSIPMLVIAGANDPSARPLGRLHEMPDQSAFGRELAAVARRIAAPEDLAAAMAEAFALFESERPGPALIEIPLGAMALDASHLPEPRRAAPANPAVPDAAALAQAGEMIAGAHSTVILVGGGGRRAAARALALAERLDAPLVTTINARSAMPAGHPLVVPASPSLAAVRALVDAADLALAIGTEICPTDYDMYAEGTTIRPKRLLRIDIDPDQTAAMVTADVMLHGDAGATLAALEPLIEPRKAGDGADRAAAAMTAALDTLPLDYHGHVALLETIRDAVPDAMLVGDSTQLVYAGNMVFAPGDRAAWFNSSVGFGTLGYALPAAIGAKLADPDRPAIAIIGDGGIQFTLGELGTIRDCGAPVVVLVWNNAGFREIKCYMMETGVEPEGVDLTPPDFGLVAEAYGLGYHRLGAELLAARLAGTLGSALADPRGAIVEIDVR